MIYQVNVKEMLEDIIDVEAESEKDAIEKVEERYYNEDIVLDSDAFVGTEFSIFKDQPFSDEDVEDFVNNKFSAIPDWMFNASCMVNDADCLTPEQSYDKIYLLRDKNLSKNIYDNDELTKSLEDIGLALFYDEIHKALFFGLENNNQDDIERYWKPIYELMAR